MIYNTLLNYFHIMRVFALMAHFSLQYRGTVLT